MVIGEVGEVRHLLQSEIAGMGQQAGIEMGQQRGPDPLQISRMDQVSGKVGPGVDLDEELRELHAGEALGNLVSEGT
jgi:hypothetical protein